MMYFEHWRRGTSPEEFAWIESEIHWHYLCLQVRATDYGAAIDAKYNIVVAMADNGALQEIVLHQEPATPMLTELDEHNDVVGDYTGIEDLAAAEYRDTKPAPNGAQKAAYVQHLPERWNSTKAGGEWTPKESRRTWIGERPVRKDTKQARLPAFTPAPP